MGRPGGPAGAGGPGAGAGPGGGPDWQHLEQFDPEMYALVKADYELNLKSEEISKQLRQLPRDQRVQLKGELAKVVYEHFDVRQKRRELQIKRMEEELKKLRDAVSKRNESRDLIVRKRQAELTNEELDQEF
jgi:ABC-type phosphate transport system auxiliary subunit